MKKNSAIYGLFQYILLFATNYYTEAIKAESKIGIITLWVISTVFFAQVCYWIAIAKRHSRRKHRS